MLTLDRKRLGSNCWVAQCLFNFLAWDMRLEAAMAMSPAKRRHEEQDSQERDIASPSLKARGFFVSHTPKPKA